MPLRLRYPPMANSYRTRRPKVEIRTPPKVTLSLSWGMGNGEWGISIAFKASNWWGCCSVPIIPCGIQHQIIWKLLTATPSLSLSLPKKKEGIHCTQLNYCWITGTHAWIGQSYLLIFSTSSPKNFPISPISSASVSSAKDGTLQLLSPIRLVSCLGLLQPEKASQAPFDSSPSPPENYIPSIFPKLRESGY